jgi:transcriptional regulator with XRE-family HTH domain
LINRYNKTIKKGGYLVSFGIKLKKARQNKMLTQEEVAKLIPMNQSNYSKIERDHQEPNLFQIRRMCEILRISSDYLLEINQNELDKDKLDRFSEEIKNLLSKYF